MPGRGGSTFRQSALWIAGSFVALIVGLVMFMHEQHAHDVCAASIRVISGSFAQPPQSCGFADTVYWSGVVVFLAAAISLIGAMWSGVSILSGSVHLKGRLNWPTGHASPAPGDFTSQVLPEPAAWLSLTSPAPFEIPKRQSQSHLAQTPHVATAPPPLPQSQHTASAPGATVTIDAKPASTPAPAPQPVDVTKPTPLPAPAWYPDPNNPDAIRWWDGARWGESRPRPS